MKIDVVGNGCTWTKQLATSYIINDQILFDVPEGSFKTLLHKYNLEKINHIIISHFHSDHFLNIHLVLDYIFNHFPNKSLTIIAPKGCKEKITALFKLLEVPEHILPLQERVNFVDLENGKKFKLDDFSIKAYQMTHNNLDSYGFTIEHNGTTIGFSGDSAMCNNIRKILKKSKICFIDSANTSPNNKHLCLCEIEKLEKEFPDCKLFRIHLSSHSMKELDKQKIFYPKQGETIIL